jgi:SAM-dependent methyltransferase
MKIIGKFSTILSFPAGYRLFSRLVGGDVWRTYMADYVKPVAGEKILDIGCGPADILNYLPGSDYTGFDISPEYIAAAQKRFAGRGRFYCNDVGLATVEQEQGTFNLVLATGVLHHLDDETAGKLFDLARLALRPDGRLVTYDGCYVPDQSKIARWFLSHDRGRFIRTRAEYLGLASARFPRVEAQLRHDLLRIPYTHLIMRCSN